MSISVPFTGGCACGVIRYECSAAPLLLALCRCRNCQRATGGPFAANVWVARSALTFTAGELKYRVVTSDQGNAVSYGFCPACGSPGSGDVDVLPIATVKAASLDDPSGLEPGIELYTSCAYPWDTLNPALPQFATMPTEEEMQALMAGRS